MIKDANPKEYEDFAFFYPVCATIEAERSEKYVSIIDCGR